MDIEYIERYKVIKVLGRGGMAVVYLCADPKMGRQVAVKVLSDELSDEPEFRDRFMKEAQTIAKLEHAAIVPVYDFGEEEDQLYLVMRCMTGGSLRDRLRKESLSLGQISEVLKPVASALDKVHKEGIIHRDIKPDNILFDEEGKPYLSDFGIARSIARDEARRSGTRRYMAPEQLTGGELDVRTDVYQLGKALFEMLTGNVPQGEHIPSVLDFDPHLPPMIDEVMACTLAKEKEKRYSSAGDLANAFDEALPKIKIEDERLSPPPPPPPPPFRLDFANREIEKRMIRQLLHSDFYVQIQAPSGLGKSYLMQEVESQLREQGWHTICIEFAGQHNRCLADRFEFLRVFSEQVDDATHVPSLGEKQLLERIALTLANTQEPVVLFIDDADKGTPRVLKWIRETFLDTLAKECLAKGQKGSLRVLAAGQQIIPEWQGVKRGRPFRQLSLSHFDDPLVLEEIINDVVTRFGDRHVQEIQAQGGEAWQSHLDTMVEGLLNISCGHPLVMAEMLRYTAEQNGFIPPTFFTDKWAELCERCLAPIVDGHILLSVDNAVREAFRSLCIFRYVWFTLIRELAKSNIREELGGSWEPFSEQRRGWRTWWSILEDTHLIKKPSNRSMFPISPVIRQVVALVLWSENEPLYRAHHHRAIQIYHDLFNSKNVASLQRAAYMLELFYHTTQASGLTPTELSSTFRQILSDFLNKLSSDELLNIGPQLLEWLREDTELATVINLVVPDLYDQLAREVYNLIKDETKNN